MKSYHLFPDESDSDFISSPHARHQAVLLLATFPEPI